LEALAGRGAHSPWRRAGPTRDFFLYLNGHGGDGYFKFRDAEEVSADAVAAALRAAWESGAFERAFVILDTCQAVTLFEAIEKRGVPNVTHLSTSDRDESSYAAQMSMRDLVPLSDGFIGTTAPVLGPLARKPASSLADLVRACPRERVLSQVVTGHSDGGKPGVRDNATANALPLRPFLTASWANVTRVGRAHLPLGLETTAEDLAKKAFPRVRRRATIPLEPCAALFHSRTTAGRPWATLRRLLFEPEALPDSAVCRKVVVRDMLRSLASLILGTALLLPFLVLLLVPAPIMEAF
jgi:hypothetical protein